MSWRPPLPSSGRPKMAGATEPSALSTAPFALPCEDSTLAIAATVVQFRWQDGVARATTSSARTVPGSMPGPATKLRLEHVHKSFGDRVVLDDITLDVGAHEVQPLVRAEIWTCLGQLKREGLTLVVIDKNIGPLARLADRHFIIEKGSTAWSGDSETLVGSPEILHQYVGV